MVVASAAMLDIVPSNQQQHEMLMLWRALLSMTTTGATGGLIGESQIRGHTIQLFGCSEGSARRTLWTLMNPAAPRNLEAAFDAATLLGSTIHGPGLKHEGKAFKSVLAEDPEYCKWVATHEAKSPAMKSLKDYLLRNGMHGHSCWLMLPRY